MVARRLPGKQAPKEEPAAPIKIARRLPGIKQQLEDWTDKVTGKSQTGSVSGRFSSAAPSGANKPKWHIEEVAPEKVSTRRLPTFKPGIMHPEKLAPRASYGDAKRLEKLMVVVSFKAKRPHREPTLYHEYRKYFLGPVELGVADVGSKSIRLHYSDVEFPTRIGMFANEKQLHEWFIDFAGTKPGEEMAGWVASSLKEPFWRRRTKKDGK